MVSIAPTTPPGMNGAGDNDYAHGVRDHKTSAGKMSEHSATAPGLNSAYKTNPLKIASWLRSSSVDFKSVLDHTYAKRTGLDSGGKFFESAEYKTWVAGKEDQDIECVGLPGKSSIASAVIEDLKRRFGSEPKSYIILYAWFKEDATQPDLIPITFTSLLGQVVEQQDRPSHMVLDLYNEYSPHVNVVPALSRVAEVLRYEVTTFKRVYVVVDMLDEYPAGGSEKSGILIGHLKSLGAKVLIASRSGVGITPEGFSKLHVSTRRDDLCERLRARMGPRPPLDADAPGLQDDEENV